MKQKLLLLSVLFIAILVGCKKDAPKSGKVETIAFDQESYTVDEGESLKLSKKLTITPQDVADTITVNWSVDKQDCATISKSGTLLAIKSGKVTVTATAGGKSASCLVNIKELTITNFTLPTTLACKENIPQELKVTVEPEGAYVGNITYKFPNEEAKNISCYEEEGKIYVNAKKEGTYHLTASYSGLKDQTCTITATIALIESVTLTSESETMEKGKTQNLTLTVTPKQAKYANVVSWKTSDSKVATVKDGVVTSVDYGEVVITAEVGKLAEGESVHTAKCTIRVAVKAIESVEISEKSLKMNKGQSKTLSVTVTPADAKYAKEIKWESSNKGVATVDANGNVKAVASGFARIDAKVGADKEGEKIHTVSCDVMVIGTVQTAKDQCGNTFRYGEIGSQVWMFENLKCNSYASQAEITGGVSEQVGTDPLKYTAYYIDATNQANWQPRTDEYKTWADQLSSTDIAQFGYAYNWAAVVGAQDDENPVRHEWTKRQGICPDGWHIPSYEEVETLVNTCGGKTNAGKYLKSTSGWHSNNGTDDFHFNAFPAAIGKYDTYGAGGETSFWTITPYSSTSKDVIKTPRLTTGTSEVLMTSSSDKNEVAFVRCVRNK